MNSDNQSTLNIQSMQRYLWAVGLEPEKFAKDTLISDRYRVFESQIVIDTQPFNLPEVPDEFPPHVISYLKLSRLPLHFPRPQALLRWGEELDLTELLLLENAPITDSGQIMPTLESSWASASKLRQLNWLWQVLQLWQPLQEQNMTLTLLQQQLVRVDGPWVRLLELQADMTQVELPQLGDLWVEWLPNAQPEISEPLAEFFYGLARGDFKIADAIACVDRITAQQFEQQPLNIRIATITDRGTRRDYNEDTCYPDAKRAKRSRQPEYLRDRVAIICDGLGGHEGGEVASLMAVNTIEQQLQVLLRQVDADPESFSPQTFIAQLETMIRVVNDLIVARNDQQHRQAQQRMGTTLVMAVAPRPQGKHGHEIYVIHVGDSRAYWVNHHSCYQITLDDDVATRESILGYNFYAYSSQRVDGGALVQALGTRASDMLVPRIQRFYLDEDCLLLLCSDGLSDFDRVAEISTDHILPILTDNQPLPQACSNLIDLANTLNGHDNSTIALMRCRLAEPDPKEDIEEEDPPATVEADSEAELTVATVIENAPTEAAEPANETEDDYALVPSSVITKDGVEVNPPQQTSRGLIIGLIFVMFLLGSGIAATQIQYTREWLNRNIPNLRLPPKL